MTFFYSRSVGSTPRARTKSPVTAALHFSNMGCICHAKRRSAPRFSGSFKLFGDLPDKTLTSRASSWALPDIREKSYWHDLPAGVGFTKAVSVGAAFLASTARGGRVGAAVLSGELCRKRDRIGRQLLPEFCSPIGAVSSKDTQQYRFKTIRGQIPSEGRKRKARGGYS